MLFCFRKPRDRRGACLAASASPVTGPALVPARRSARRLSRPGCKARARPGACPGAARRPVRPARSAAFVAATKTFTKSLPNHYHSFTIIWYTICRLKQKGRSRVLARLALRPLSRLRAQRLLPLRRLSVRPVARPVPAFARRRGAAAARGRRAAAPAFAGARRRRRFALRSVGFLRLRRPARPLASRRRLSPLGSLALPPRLPPPLRRLLLLRRSAACLSASSIIYTAPGGGTTGPARAPAPSLSPRSPPTATERPSSPRKQPNTHPPALAGVPDSRNGAAEDGGAVQETPAHVLRRLRHAPARCLHVTPHRPP